MRTAAVAFIISMLCGTFLTPLVRRLAYHFGALDHARSSRKIHGHPIPRLGGVAIVVAFYAPMVGLLLLHSGVGSMFVAERAHVIGLFAGGIIIALLGLYDDLRGANAWKKFAVQFAVAGLLFALGFRFDVLANPFGQPIDLGWANLPFTLFWIVGVINAMNLIDGLDGLAGGVALVAVVTTFLISLQRAHPLMMLFSSALAGSIVGFLFYNFNPASIFMGDTGSMFLGFVLATTAMQTNQKASTTVAVLIPCIALGLPIMDTLLAIGRRAIRGRPLFQADKEHIHHKLMDRGLSHRQAVLVLYGFCVLLGVAALVLTYANSGQAAFTRLRAIRSDAGVGRRPQAQPGLSGRLATARPTSQAAPDTRRDVAHRGQSGRGAWRRPGRAAARPCGLCRCGVCVVARWIELAGSTAGGEGSAWRQGGGDGWGNGNRV
jgi:UDP-GlcNAc:undecaprenyl-phosphate GlcNAc-1-phosphate transferase